MDDESGGDNPELLQVARDVNLEQAMPEAKLPWETTPSSAAPELFPLEFGFRNTHL